MYSRRSKHPTNLNLVRRREEAISAGQMAVSDIMKRMPKEDRSFFQKIAQFLKDALSTDQICVQMGMSKEEFRKEYNNLRGTYPGLYLEDFDEIFGDVEQSKEVEKPERTTVSPAQTEIEALRERIRKLRK